MKKETTNLGLNYISVHSQIATRVVTVGGSSNGNTWVSRITGWSLAILESLAGSLTSGCHSDGSLDEY